MKTVEEIFDEFFSDSIVAFEPFDREEVIEVLETNNIEYDEEFLKDLLYIIEQFQQEEDQVARNNIRTELEEYLDTELEEYPGVEYLDNTIIASILVSLADSYLSNYTLI